MNNTYQGRGIDDGKVVAKLKCPTNTSRQYGQEQDLALNSKREGEESWLPMATRPALPSQGQMQHPQYPRLSEPRTHVVCTAKAGTWRPREGETLGPQGFWVA